MTLQPEIKSGTGKYDFHIFLIVLALLSLFMVCWYGPQSEYAGHDYYFNLGRFKVLIHALESGTYPIYLDHDAMNSYGYFTKAFYPDLILFPFAALAILTGVGFAYNAMIFTLTFLCGLFMYHAVDTVFRNKIMASFSAVLYTFSAYHLFDWYNRGALGESISFAFLPIVFLGLYNIISGDCRKWYVLTIGYTLLIYTHLLSSFLTFITLAIIVLVSIRPLIKEPKRIGYLLLASVVTIPLVASYIIPMFEQMASNTFNYSDAVNITGQTKLSIKDIGWGILSGLIYPSDSNMSGTGPLLIIILILRFFIKEKSPMLRIADFCLSIGIVYIIIMSFIFPWGRLPLGFIQFPWRLYEFVTFFFAIAGSFYLVTFFKTQGQYRAVVVGILVITIAVIILSNNNYKHWQSQTKKEAPEWFTGVPVADNEYYLGGREYMPARVPSYRIVEERGDSITSSSALATTSGLVKKDGETTFNVSVTEPADLELPLLYYKGYNASLNDQDLQIEQSDRGFIQIPVDKPGEVKVYYGGTVIQRISWYITLFSALAFGAYIFINRRKKKIG